MKEAEAAVGKAEAFFYPTLQLTGAVNGARQGDVSLAGDDFGNTLFLNMSWNLFAGGEDKARRFEAEQARREVNYALINLRNQVASEVRQDVALLEAAREQVVLQRESLKLVEENRELAKNEYEAFQVIITAGTGKKLENVKIEISDLEGENGKIGKENLALFRAEDVHLRHPSPRSAFGPG
ncbi:MAG: TolC family protein, partial [Desulfobulbales bacterium]